MRHFAVSAIGRDRPGIVAAVTQRLLDHGLNVEDSQMTILRGRFSMTLVVAGDAEAEPVARDLSDTAAELGLDALSVDEVADTREPAGADPSHIVTVYGADHPGIVHAVAAALAARDVNITDLNTRLVGDQEPDGRPLYAMLLEVALPTGLDAGALEQALADCRTQQGVEVSVRELEPDTL